jgi:hypothetical protein
MEPIMDAYIEAIFKNCSHLTDACIHCNCADQMTNVLKLI